MFNGCPDEEGFMLVHVAIESESYRQVRAYEQIFSGIQNDDRDSVNQGLYDHMKYLEDIENIFNKMWRTSIPRNFGNFRTFVMGIKGNDEIFPNGVVYESEFDNKPQFYRGASGA